MNVSIDEQFELYLIRHGLAAERGENYPDDTKRPLTTRGIQRLKRESKALLALDVTFDVILTSPLVRTRQTAEVIAAGFRQPPPIVNAASLAPGGSHNAIVDELAKQSHRRKKIAIVGHEPGIGELAGRLLGLRKGLEFKKGAICRIDVTALPPTGAGQLKWFLTPRILRKIGK
jgi:phosphohistidine phosphatase